MNKREEAQGIQREANSVGRAAKLRPEKGLERKDLESQVNSVGFIWEDTGCYDGAQSTGKMCFMKIPLVVSVDDGCQEG